MIILLHNNVRLSCTLCIQGQLNQNTETTRDFCVLNDPNKTMWSRFLICVNICIRNINEIYKLFHAIFFYFRYWAFVSDAHKLSE